MPIAQLPAEAIRLIGSSVTISDPASLVKELLDNAIDAGATSVSILISENTVDKIQVRDNGRGISLNDLESLGRRAHTSKLRSFEELRDGVQTLGFRGDALASANCIAQGGLLVTTRTIEERIASQVRLNPQEGGVKERRLVPAPVGTTITADGLFDKIPVRKQQAVKESRKSLARIRDLLLAYALARPSLKLSLKVPGEPQQGWNYSPASYPTTQNVVLQMFGKDLSSQCMHTELKRAADIDCHSSRGLKASLTLEAFLPVPNCNFGVIKGKGAFVSIDSRPVTSVRGTGKKLASVFKSTLLQATGSRKVQSPFMQLNIRCSPGTYDPNIATLKDEVLFLDEERIINCFEELCRTLRREHDEREENYDDARPTTGVRPMSLDEPRSEEQYAVDLQASPKLLQVQCVEQIHSDPVLDEDFTLADEDHAMLQLLEAELQNDNNEHDSPDEQRNEVEPGTCTDTNSNDNVRSRPISKNARITFNVDMARKVSDVTDENSTADEITVHMPAEPIMTNKCDASLSKSKGLSDRTVPIYQMEDIHRYFRPRGTQDFEIAANDTATEEASSTVDAEAPVLDKAETRPPLQPIQNEHQDETQRRSEERSLSPPFDLEILRPQHAPQGDVDMPYLRPNVESRLNRRENRTPSPRAQYHVMDGPGANSVSSSPRYEPPSPSLFVPDSPDFITPPSSNSRVNSRTPLPMTRLMPPPSSPVAASLPPRGPGRANERRRNLGNTTQVSTGPRQNSNRNSIGNMQSSRRRNPPASSTPRAPRTTQRKPKSLYDVLSSGPTQS